MYFNQIIVKIFIIILLFLSSFNLHAKNVDEKFLETFNAILDTYKYLYDGHNPENLKNYRPYGQPRMLQFILNRLLISKKNNNFKINDYQAFFNSLKFLEVNSSIQGVLWKFNHNDFSINFSENLDNYSIGDILHIYVTLYRVTNDKFYKNKAKFYFDIILNKFIGKNYEVYDLLNSELNISKKSYTELGRAILLIDSLIHYDIYLGEKKNTQLIINLIKNISYTNSKLIKEVIINDPKLSDLNENEREYVSNRLPITQALTYGEIFETLFFANYAYPENNFFMNEIEKLVKEQIKYFYNEEYQEFFYLVNNTDGKLVNNCSHHMIYESAAYSLIKLSVETGNPYYADLIKKSFDNHLKNGLKNDFFVNNYCYQDNGSIKFDFKTSLGHQYGYLKTLIYLYSYFEDDSYLKIANKIIEKSKLFIKNQSFYSNINLETNEFDKLNFDIGAAVWFYNEGLVPYYFSLNKINNFKLKQKNKNFDFLGGDYIFID